jgi:hypothetical protein
MNMRWNDILGFSRKHGTFRGAVGRNHVGVPTCSDDLCGSLLFVCAAASSLANHNSNSSTKHRPLKPPEEALLDLLGGYFIQ